MSSSRRINASRANGALSRGPITPQGKTRSSLNALDHGLTAQTVVLQCESQESFQTTLDNFLVRFQPVDTVELSLVHEMVAAAWRLQRVWDIEGRIFEMCVEGSRNPSDSAQLAKGFYNFAVGPQFNLMHRYESRLHMIFQRALNTLTMLQKARMQNEP
jgi:hypothetical protein